MPIYAYRCDSCGVEKDVLQKLSDAPLTVCPECGAGSFHKKLSAPAFQLKGSGWYVTDFRDGSGRCRKRRPGRGAGTGCGRPRGAAAACGAGGFRSGQRGRAQGFLSRGTHTKRGAACVPDLPSGKSSRCASTSSPAC